MAAPHTRSLAAAFELGKPRLAVAATVLALCGFALASTSTPSIVQASLLAIGMLFTSFGSGAMNMVLEKHIDARMLRTADRPLPSGRLSPAQATTYSIGCTLAGLVSLSAINWQSSLAGGLMFALYAFAYTPLKSRTIWNTVVGAVPGALPPLVGTLAATARIESWGASLFAVTFFWQIPHFLPLACMYADDYARGGMRMLPGSANGRAKTARWMVMWMGATVLASALPLFLSIVAPWAALPIVSLGFWYGYRVLSLNNPEDSTAMLVLFHSSLRYLALLIAIFVATGENIVI